MGCGGLGFVPQFFEPEGGKRAGAFGGAVPFREGKEDLGGAERFED